MEISLCAHSNAPHNTPVKRTAARPPPKNPLGRAPPAPAALRALRGAGTPLGTPGAAAVAGGAAVEGRGVPGGRAKGRAVELGLHVLAAFGSRAVPPARSGVPPARSGVLPPARAEARVAPCQGAWGRQAPPAGGR